VKVCRLPQDILASEIIAASLQHLNQRLGSRVAHNRKVVGLVAARIVLIHEGGSFLEAWVTVPGWIGGIFGIAGGENAPGISESGGPEHRPDRARYVVHEVQRLPADLSHLLDCLGGEFGGGDIKEDVGPGGF